MEIVIFKQTGARIAPLLPQHQRLRRNREQRSHSEQRNYSKQRSHSEQRGRRILRLGIVGIGVKLTVGVLDVPVVTTIAL